VILLDAHLDYRDKSLDMEFTNNSSFRPAHELPFIKRIVTIGVRGIKSTDREYPKLLAMVISSSQQTAFMMCDRHDLR
jgi:arginase family enzyme